MLRHAAALVVLLFAGDAQAAWQSYQDLLDVPAFSESTEAMAIEALFAAFAASDSTLIVKKAAHSDFKQLDASVRPCFKATDWTFTQL